MRIEPGAAAAGLVIALFCLPVGPSFAAGLPAQDEPPVIEFFLGEWDVRVLTPNGDQQIGRARTEVRRILDSAAIQADYYGLDPAGNTVFRGTTIRTWVPQLGSFVVHWAMAGVPGYTYLEEKYENGELQATGHGVDPQGEFLERYRYYDISDTTYSFEGTRSYDGGETWQRFANLHATKRVDGTP